jgi:hypothetical protein
MANNIFISYDLKSPGQDYSKIISEIKTLGPWAKVLESLWFVSTTLSASDVVSKLKTKIDYNDSIIVIDAKNNNASWHNLNNETSNFIKSKWS